MQFHPDTRVLGQRESQARGYSRRFDVVFERAIGSVLVTTTGRRCIDFLAGGGTLNYGHNDPDLVQALVQHLQAQGLAAGPDLHSGAKQQFLKTFSAKVLAPRGLSHRVQFTGPGDHDPLDAALALARKATGRSQVIAFGNSHPALGAGPTAPVAPVRNGAGAAGHLWRSAYDGYHGPEVDTAEQLSRWLDDPASGLARPAAIVVEMVQADTGLRAASPAWLRRISGLAQRHGALLVLDDSRAGGGRCGGFFSFEGLGVMPDLVLPSRALSGLGLPMGLLLVRADRDLWAPAELSSCFQHNHHALATAAAACDKFWSDGRFQQTVAQRAALLSAGLQGVARLVPGALVLGNGLLQGLDVGDGGLADRIMSLCFDRGLMLETGGPGDAVLRITPALTIPTLLLEQGLAILYRCAAEATGQKARSAPHRALAAVHAAARNAVPRAAG